MTSLIKKMRRAERKVAKGTTDAAATETPAPVAPKPAARKPAAKRNRRCAHAGCPPPASCPQSPVSRRSVDLDKGPMAKKATQYKKAAYDDSPYYTKFDDKWLSPLEHKRDHGKKMGYTTTNGEVIAGAKITPVTMKAIQMLEVHYGTLDAAFAAGWRWENVWQANRQCHAHWFWPPTVRADRRIGARATHLTTHATFPCMLRAGIVRRLRWQHPIPSGRPGDAHGHQVRRGG